MFKAFEEQSPGNNIATIFTPWTEQSGYPLVTVEKTSNNQVRLKQKRFFLEPEESNLKWTIPITYATNSSDFDSTATRATLLPTAERTLTLQEGDLDFYIFNVQQVGYYRVNYDKENWEAIRKALKTDNYGKIHRLNRAQIVDDLFNLAQSGEIDYRLTFDVIDYLESEIDYIPWLSAINGLTHISRRIANNQDLGEFETYINTILTPVYEKLGFEPKQNELHIDTLNRVNVLSWLCKHKNEDCITKAKAEFTKFKQGTHV